MMEAGPSAFLIMAKLDFLFKFLRIAFDPPAQLCGVDQLTEWDVARQC